MQDLIRDNDIRLDDSDASASQLLTFVKAPGLIENN